MAAVLGNTAVISQSLSSSTEVTIASWYSASLANNYATPSLLDLLGNPLTLNMLEQFSMVLVASIALPAYRVQLLPTRKTLSKVGGVVPILAMGLANAITTRLFMVSLQHLPLSLCHTIRACSPCVAAGIGLLRGKNFSTKQLSSLPIIVAGFGLAVSAQPSCSKVGVYAAIGSLLAMSALQHISKDVLDKGMHELQCQFLQCALCLIFLVGSNYNHNYHSFSTIRDLTVNNNINNYHKKFRLLTLLNCVGDYVENVAATKAVGLFDELTFAVFDTLRRLSVILLCGFVARKNPARISNISGTLLVLIGALLYQQGSISNSISRKERRQDSCQDSLGQKCILISKTILSVLTTTITSKKKKARNML